MQIHLGNCELLIVRQNHLIKKLYNSTKLNKVNYELSNI